MLDLQTPPQWLVQRDFKPAAVKPVTVAVPRGPFSPEEWARLHKEDRWLASVLGVMALTILSTALAVYGTIAALAAFGWL